MSCSPTVSTNNQVSEKSDWYPPKWWRYQSFFLIKLDVLQIMEYIIIND